MCVESLEDECSMQVSCTPNDNASVIICDSIERSLPHHGQTAQTTLLREVMQTDRYFELQDIINRQAIL